MRDREGVPNNVFFRSLRRFTVMTHNMRAPALPALFIVLGSIVLFGWGCQQSPPPQEKSKEEKLPAYAALYVPHLQAWGFDNRDPVVEIGGYQMSFQVFTKENTYGIAADRIERKQEGNRWTLHASELTWAGQQERAPGTLDVVAEQSGDRLTLSLVATAKSPVRGVKATIHGLPQGRVGWASDPEFHPVTPEGSLYSYPAWSAGMPVLLLADAEGRGIAFTTADIQPRPKRFAVYKSKGGTNLELIFEEDARHWSPKLAAPAWEITPNTTLPAAIDARLAYLEAKAGLKKWQDRTDVPAWARDISLVVSIHGMHWGGYIFNDYAKALETVRWVTQRIEPKRVLVFLPGWEGRYYWQYGDYRPDPRLGGPEGFQRMIDGMHQLGVHVMPMFGGNCANAWFPNYKSFGPQSLIMSGTGIINQGNNPDWDMFRNRDTGWQQWLNPGAPGWQNHLVGQIDGLLNKYGFDGVFLDTQPSMDNDARYAPLEGLRQICERLRVRHKNLLIATEASNELSMGFVPVNHTRGGFGNWPSRYVRRYCYLGEGEPGRGSTGVEEDGTIPYNLKELLENYDWPTISFVEDTLQVAPDKVQAVLDQAKIYARDKLK
jgi:hypothetical protein